MSSKEGKLEEALAQAMKAIDNQVARALQRSPAERDLEGVQKWEPYDVRVENVTAFILNSLGENEVTLDSVLVFAQAFTKALRFASEDLGVEGLGKMRSAYCLDALEKISNDAAKGRSELRSQELT